MTLYFVAVHNIRYVAAAKTKKKLWVWINPRTHIRLCKCKENKSENEWKMRLINFNLQREIFKLPLLVQFGSLFEVHWRVEYVSGFSIY